MEKDAFKTTEAVEMEASLSYLLMAANALRSLGAYRRPDGGRCPSTQDPIRLSS
jgi:hypothetical protein